MQTVSPVFTEGERRQVTLDSHTQAVERAIQVMHSHLYEPLTLADLASVACLSIYYFNRVFRRLIGVPPGEFLSALRLHAARHLLLTTPLRVTDICFEVGYNSPSSFTTRFTQAVGLSPRLLRQRAHEFRLPKPVTHFPSMSDYIQVKNTIQGTINAPADFQGSIYVGLFSTPIPQGVPIRCTQLSSPGTYRMIGIPDGVYYLLSAAFPMTNDPQSYILPGNNILVGSNVHPLVLYKGHVSGNLNLDLHPPRLTDPPLVLALPL